MGSSPINLTTSDEMESTYYDLFDNHSSPAGQHRHEIRVVAFAALLSALPVVLCRRIAVTAEHRRDPCRRHGLQRHRLLWQRNPYPNLDKLAAGGLRFTQFYNTARCCPTRGTLLTGLYSHQAGVGHMTEDRGEDGYRGDSTTAASRSPKCCGPPGTARR